MEYYRDLIFYNESFHGFGSFNPRECYMKSSKKSRFPEAHRRASRHYPRIHNLKLQPKKPKLYLKNPNHKV